MLWVCHPILQILTLFHTKKGHFPHPFLNLASKIHTRFQTWPLRNYVAITKTYTPVVLLNTLPDGQSLYLFLDWNSAKTIPFGWHIPIWLKGAPPENSVGQRRLRYRIIGTQTKPDFQEQMKLIIYLKSTLHVTSTREFWFVRLQVFSLFVQIKWGECMHASLKWLFLSLGHFAQWTNEKGRLLIVYWLVDFLSSPYNVILGVLLCMRAFCLHIIVSWDSLHLSTLLC